LASVTGAQRLTEEFWNQFGAFVVPGRRNLEDEPANLSGGHLKDLPSGNDKLAKSDQ
jgi:hypothetical protein